MQIPPELIGDCDDGVGRALRNPALPGMRRSIIMAGPLSSGRNTQNGSALVELQGSKICLIGSASVDRSISPDLEAAQKFVSALIPVLLDNKATLVLGELKDLEAHRATIPLTFDWTALRAVKSYIEKHGNRVRTPLVTILAPESHRKWIFEEAPSDLKEVWDAIDKYIDPQFRLDSVEVSRLIYEERAETCDLLLAIGGGAGTDLTVNRFKEQSKPVIPYDFRLGSRHNDGEGEGWDRGGRRWAQLARTNPDEFKFEPGLEAQGRAAFQRLSPANSLQPAELAARTLAFCQMLKPPHQGGIFIGHGRSGLWKDLRDYIRDDLNLPHVHTFETKAIPGDVISEQLAELLKVTNFAFLLLTGEDEAADHTMHPRENVIHEVGLFQGRHGFKRAVILLEEGCERFTNLDGQIYIPFPKGNINGAFDKVWRVLKANGFRPQLK